VVAPGKSSSALSGTRDKARQIAADPKKQTNDRERPHQRAVSNHDDHRTVGEVSMSSKDQTRNLQGNKTKSHSDLARHYREIGIKAVTAAARAGVRLTALVRENNREKENSREEKETDE
jgi:hypothetical protein